MAEKGRVLEIQLNRHQRMLMDLVVLGKSTHEIAESTGISEITVSIVLGSVVDRLDARNLIQAAILYKELDKDQNK